MDFGLASHTVMSDFKLGFANGSQEQAIGGRERLVYLFPWLSPHRLFQAALPKWSSPLSRFSTASSPPLQVMGWQCSPHIVPSPRYYPLWFPHTVPTLLQIVPLLNSSQLPIWVCHLFPIGTPSDTYGRESSLTDNHMLGMWIKQIH